MLISPENTNVEQFSQSQGKQVWLNVFVNTAEDPEPKKSINKNRFLEQNNMGMQVII